MKEIQKKHQAIKGEKNPSLQQVNEGKPLEEAEVDGGEKTSQFRVSMTPRAKTSPGDLGRAKHMCSKKQQKWSEISEGNKRKRQAEENKEVPPHFSFPAHKAFGDF